MRMSKTCWLCGGTISETVAEKLGTPICELGLSTRPYNALKRHGIKYVEQILKLTFDDLLKIRNFGTVCAKELNEKIAAMGFVG